MERGARSFASGSGANGFGVKTDYTGRPQQYARPGHTALRAAQHCTAHSRRAMVTTPSRPPFSGWPKHGWTSLSPTQPPNQPPGSTCPGGQLVRPPTHPPTWFHLSSGNSCTGATYWMPALQVRGGKVRGAHQEAHKARLHHPDAHDARQRADHRRQARRLGACCAYVWPGMLPPCLNCTGCTHQRAQAASRVHHAAQVAETSTKTPSRIKRHEKSGTKKAASLVHQDVQLAMLLLHPPHHVAAGQHQGHRQH